MKKSKQNNKWAVVCWASFLLGASAASGVVSLGTAENFGVLGGSAVTNTGSSLIVGDVGVSPGSSVTGFPPGVVMPPGSIHAGDAVAAQAQADLATAYNSLASTPTLVDLTGTNLGGLTLGPGVYGFNSSAQLTGGLILDAQGNPDAIFIFKIASSLTTASGSSVSVINGGSDCNVFWQIGSSATLGTATSFAGNLLALTSITLNTGAATSGRALARNGAVTLDGSNVTICPRPPIVCPAIVLNPATLPAGEVGTAYSQLLTASGSAALPYTYAVSSGALPAGLLLNSGTGLLNGVPTSFGTFSFIVTATDANGCTGSHFYSIVIAGPACPPIELAPVALPSGVIGAFYNSTVVASGGTPPYAYTLSSGALPPGLALNSTTGAITGTPLSAGIFTFTILATDALGCPGSREYSVSISQLASIPTLSDWSLVLLALLMGMTAVKGLRRDVRAGRRAGTSIH